MTDEQFETVKALIGKWQKEAAIYQKQVEAARVRNQNANEDAFMPFRNTEGHMAQLRLCAHELEGALGLRKKLQAPGSDKSEHSPCPPASSQS